MKLKRLKDQTIVITGATSGIGLATARMAARAGASVVLSGRSAEALESVCEEIEAAGGKAAAVVADVSNPEDVRRLAEEAVRRFGGFDTWVNNAGVSIYGNVFDIPIEDQRKLFETNYWGVVTGSSAALQHLKGKGTGGAIINVGSVVSDRAFPLQGVYSASKADAGRGDADPAGGDRHSFRAARQELHGRAAASAIAAVCARIGGQGDSACGPKAHAQPDGGGGQPAILIAGALFTAAHRQINAGEDVQ